MYCLVLMAYYLHSEVHVIPLCALSTGEACNLHEVYWTSMSQKQVHEYACLQTLFLQINSNLCFTFNH